MKEKVFIIVYIEKHNDTTTYVVLAKTPKGALKKAYMKHNPEHDKNDNGDLSIENDFYVRTNIVATIKNTDIKNVKIF